jgi:hypothetical protein
VAEYDLAKTIGQAHLIVSADVQDALDLEPIGAAVRETVATLAPGFKFSYDLYAVRSIRSGGDDEENG